MRRPPTIQLLSEMAHAALDNGRDLIIDAELLLAHGRTPRAMALSILAQEELSKALLLWLWISILRDGRRLDPSKMWKALQSHEAKLTLLGIIKALFDLREHLGAPMQ